MRLVTCLPGESILQILYEAFIIYLYLFPVVTILTLTVHYLHHPAAGAAGMTATFQASGTSSSRTKADLSLSWPPPGSPPGSPGRRRLA